MIESAIGVAGARKFCDVLLQRLIERPSTLSVAESTRHRVFVDNSYFLE
jgi:hypothetical protein